VYETAFENIDDTRWKDAGFSCELAHSELTSWVLFVENANQSQ